MTGSGSFTANFTPGGEICHALLGRNSRGK
jgi:hypothetical protein